MTLTVNLTQFYLNKVRPRFGRAEKASRWDVGRGPSHAHLMGPSGLHPVSRIPCGMLVWFVFPAAAGPCFSIPCFLSPQIRVFLGATARRCRGRIYGALRNVLVSLRRR